MKATVQAVVLLIVIFCFASCKREGTKRPQAAPKVVTFAGSGISLTTTGKWEEVSLATGPGMCPPTLAGKAGIVQVTIWPAQHSDLAKAAAILRGAFEPKAIEGSFKEGEFTTKTGLRCLQLSYKKEFRGSRKVTEQRIDEYLVLNRQGRIVQINCEMEDPEVVHTMIRDSLTLQDESAAVVTGR